MNQAEKTKDKQSSDKKQIDADEIVNQNVFLCSITKTNTHGKFCSYDGVVGWICHHDPEHMVP